MGIVAAVLGIVKTMGSIDQPPEVLGKMIGAALVGTFLGVLLAYGIVGPLAGRLKQINSQDQQIFHSVKQMLIASLNGYPHALAVESARSGMPGSVRPALIELLDLLKAQIGWRPRQPPTLPTCRTCARSSSRRSRCQEAGHHGGAWKVAYADFVTAMMAFFLMLWLLGATTEAQRKGIADHFTPTLVTLREDSAGSNGMLQGSSITEADNYPNAAGQTGTQTITVPRDSTGGAREGAAMDPNAIERANALSEEIKEKLRSREKLAKLARQVRVMKTPEGIRIDLVDNADFSMFALGTTMLVPDARAMLQVIAETIRDDATDITVRGHTDALPWRAGRQ